jgi:FlaA1/EpsC-like NDP-sugar epimerase
VTALLETLDWHGFLARPHVPAPLPEALRCLAGTRILITGAGGSIGAALALRLAALAPARLILLEASESHLFALQNAFVLHASKVPVAFALGGIADAALIDELFDRHAPQLVVHAAAFKHVPLLEEQPLAAIANNVFGTRALAEAAARHGARLVLLSTDKAVAPASVMGATKRIAEQIVLARSGTALRLGNVLASRDSVAEVFAAELAADRPLTVTDPAARRYFLTIDEAVNLLLAAAFEEPGLFAAVLEEPHYIADLARFLAAQLAPNRSVAIEFSHLRSGDKETEQFWSSRESARPAQATGLLTIDSPQPEQLDDALDALRAALAARDTASALAGLACLVPDFTPSTALLALAQQHAAEAAQ